MRISIINIISSLSFLLIFPAIGHSQSRMEGLWYSPDSISNARLVFPIDSVFLLKELTLERNPDFEYAELEGIIFNLEKESKVMVCADYRQRIEEREGEKVLMIYELGCSTQKYESITWEHDAEAGQMTLHLKPHSKDVPPSSLRYGIQYLSSDKIILRRKE